VVLAATATGAVALATACGRVAPRFAGFTAVRLPPEAFFV
jgi:hypothetical protein